jgi:hypothetical protein
MKLHRINEAYIPEKKITEYLLNRSHPDGKSKAVFFGKMGFRLNAPRELADALHKHASTHEVNRVKSSDFGTNYVIKGWLETPSGRTPIVCAVWFIEEGGQAPRLVTAYPA